MSVDDPSERRGPGASTGDKSLSELLSQLMAQVTTLFREEVELAKVELKQEATRAGRASAKLVAAGVMGLIAVLLLSSALAWAIALILPTWAGFFIVGAVYAVAALALGAAGRGELQRASLKPEQTVRSLKEDREWLKHPTG